MTDSPRVHQPSRQPHRPASPPRRRTLTSLLALALATILLTVCSGDDGGGATAGTVTGPITFEFVGDAATIDGEAVPASVIADTIAVFEAAPQALQGAFGQDELTEAGSDQPKPAIVASILSTEIAARVIEGDVQDRGLAPSDQATALAETQMKAFFGDALDGQSDYLESLIARYANYVTLDQALQGPPPDEAALRAEYDKNPAAYEQACARHILVKTEEEAVQLLAQLNAGADFAELAKASSTDPGSGAKGGELGCQPRGVFVEPFENAVWNGELNVVQGPIQTEFGSHLIEVSSRGQRTFEDVREEIANILAPEPFAVVGDLAGIHPADHGHHRRSPFRDLGRSDGSGDTGRRVHHRAVHQPGLHRDLRCRCVLVQLVPFRFAGRSAHVDCPHPDRTDNERADNDDADLDCAGDDCVGGIGHDTMKRLAVRDR